MPLNNLKKRVRQLQEFDAVKATVDIINANQEYINELLRSQLAQGKDFEGQNVTVFGRDYYSDRTVFDKTFGNYPPLGKITEWITNYRHGDFYAEMFTIAEGHVFRTISRVPYFDQILARSGDRIMKLNAENRLKFSEEILIPQLRLRLYNGV